MKTQEVVAQITNTLAIHDAGGLHDLVGPLRRAQDALYKRLLRIEQLEFHLAAVLNVCAGEGLHGHSPLDDAADILEVPV